jgi:ParB family chromosome partitioning protein
VENVTEAQTADGTPAPAPLSPVEKLEKQDERNKEIALERTVEDTKKQILEADITGGKFSADEDTMLYFFLLSSLRKEHFAAVGIAEDKQYITDEDKMGIIGNLTVRMKTIIRRDFLVANFKGAYGNNTVATLLLDFAQKHMPDLLADIKNGHNEVYEKRHQRIEEKKAVLLVQEQAKQEAEQSDKQQSEVGMQTEEQPQEEDIAA